MWMRIGAAHHGTLVLEYFDIPYAGIFGHSPINSHPGTHNILNLSLTKFSQSQVVGWVEANDLALSYFGTIGEQPL